jgi:hypothetical protein
MLSWRRAGVWDLAGIGALCARQRARARALPLHLDAHRAMGGAPSSQRAGLNWAAGAGMVEPTLASVLVLLVAAEEVAAHATGSSSFDTRPRGSSDTAHSPDTRRHESCAEVEQLRNGCRAFGTMRQRGERGASVGARSLFNEGRGHIQFFTTI